MASTLTIIAMLASCLAIVLAAPQGSTPTLARRSTCILLAEQTATFEDLKATDANPFHPIPTGYKDLEWQGFTTGQDIEIKGAGGLLTKVLPGLTLDTPNNFAATGVVGQLAAGGQPRLTAVYTGSKVSAFTLDSLAYACIVNFQNEVTDAPIGCTLILRGYRVETGESPVCEKTLYYTPAVPALGHQPMASTAKQGLDIATDCKDVSYIDFSYFETDFGAITTESAVLALVIDTVVLTPSACTS